MKSPFQILHLEDDPYDAALVQGTLKAGGIVSATLCVETEEHFVAALTQGGIDLILSDYTLPQFDGLSALKIAQAERPDLPFIFVSGTLGEDQAIASLKSGAVDYVLKKHLSRLPEAIRHAMQAVEERAERRQYESRALLRKRLIIPPQRTTTILPRVTPPHP
jgi:DNA-binding NtrC family response regulator